MVALYAGPALALEDDCWAMIIHFIKDEPAIMCRCAEVCGAFHALCGSDDFVSEEIWKEVCVCRWVNKLNKKLSAGKRASARHLEFRQPHAFPAGIKFLKVL